MDGFSPRIQGAGYSGGSAPSRMGHLSSPRFPGTPGLFVSTLGDTGAALRALPSPSGSPWGWICCTRPRPLHAPSRRGDRPVAPVQICPSRGPAHNCRRLPQTPLLFERTMSPSLSDPTGGLSTHDAALGPERDDQVDQRGTGTPGRGQGVGLRLGPCWVTACGRAALRRRLALSRRAPRSAFR